MPSSRLVTFLLLCAVLSAGGATQPTATHALLELDIPPGLLVPPAVHLDLTELAQALGIEAPVPENPPCFLEDRDEKRILLLSQFDPDPDYDRKTHAVGTLSFRLPQGVSGKVRVRVVLAADHPPLGPVPSIADYRVEQADGTIVITNRDYRVTHDPRRQAGFPLPIEFRRSGKILHSFNWNDRVYKAGLGGFYLRQTQNPKVELVCSGPVRTVVRLHLAFTQGDARPTSRPEAIYEFTYYAGLPFIELHGRFTQADTFKWPELKCTEMHFPGLDFSQYATNATGGTVDLQADKKMHTGQWAALLDGENVLGLTGQSVRIYDGHGGYGTYLHGPWVQWSNLEKSFTEMLYVAAGPQALANFRNGAAVAGQRLTWRVTTPAFLAALASLDQAVQAIPDPARRRRYRWARALAERAGHDEKRLGPALALVHSLIRATAGNNPADDPMNLVEKALGGRLICLATEEVGLAFRQLADNRLQVYSLFAFDADREHLAAPALPLFAVEVSQGPQNKISISSDDHWKQVTFEPRQAAGKPFDDGTIHWTSPADTRLAGLAVAVHVHLHGAKVEWKISVENAGTTWGVRRVDFPRIRLRRLDRGEDCVFVPLGSGVLTRHPIREWRGYSGGYRSGEGFAGRYPSAWCSMQFGGYYDELDGVMFAAHDPLASTKDIRFRPEKGGIRCEFSWPAENMGLPGTGFEHPGTCVTTVFRGDWFTAARLYRHWLARQAPWWPGGSLQGRPDTPQWMREMVMWAHEMGDAKRVVEPCIELQRYLGVPLAVHWYSWHKIRFDKDYPHYFPAREGFAAGVKKLQENGIRVMPYINGRLWDRDTKDFPDVALPAATKNEAGKCFVERYGSGADLVPMCPTTRVWQDKILEIVLRLTGPQYHVDGVYIDQVSATEPCLCFDRTHGHPLGGGHWWTVDGYWPMLRSIQKQLPAGKMITSECTAEPYCRWLDGYLSWHFQCPGQIPLFAAIYGGNVQIFGRAYKGRDELAHRMKLAQSLVYGEQLGWMSTAQVFADRKVFAPFVRRVARLRHALRPYLCGGNMAPVPVVDGDIPEVTADWAWHHAWPVTDTALQRGAWKAADGRLVLIFVNVIGRTLAGHLSFHGTEYGFDRRAALRVTPRTENGPEAAVEKPGEFELGIEIPAYGVMAYEIAANPPSSSKSQ